jgi:hypothetical protein
MAIDWSSAPEGAEFYADGYFRREKDGVQHFWHPQAESWWNSGFPAAALERKIDYVKRPQQWPETDERINNIGLNRTEDDTGHYDMEDKLDSITVYSNQREPETPHGNKYDRTIIGKYGTGKCTVDVYRVLNAFPTGSPEIDHALKKLLAAGKRGAKDELQDLREAVQSIEARIDYLTELGA